MVDEELKEKMEEKIADEEFTVDDLPEYMTLFCQICNENDEIQDEIDEEGFRNKVMHFYLDGAPDFTMEIKDRKFSWKPGTEGDWGAMLKVSAENFAKLVIGEEDGQNLYMAEELEAHGGLPAMIKFQTIAGIVLEEIEGMF